MTTTTLVLLVISGLAIGMLGGTLGIGGGVLIVPVLVFLLNFKQQEAVGTSVAVLLPPIGLFAALTYWRAGSVNIPVAVVFAVTFALGAWLGSWLATTGWIPDKALRIMFGLFLVYIAGLMLFRGDEVTWSATRTILLVIAALVGHVAAKLAGRRWESMTSALTLYGTQRKRPFATDYDI